MTAGVYTVVIEQGATFRLRLSLTNNGVVVPLSGHTARMHIRQKIAASDVLYELTTTNGGLVINGLAGTVDLYISDEDTATFQFRNAVYDLELEDTGTGEVVRVLQGAVQVSPEVTR